MQVAEEPNPDETVFVLNGTNIFVKRLQRSVHQRYDDRLDIFDAGVALRLQQPQRHRWLRVRRELYGEVMRGGEEDAATPRGYSTSIFPCPPPSTTSPITAAAGVSLARNAAMRSSARDGSTAIKRPPEVCASASSNRTTSFWLPAQVV